VDCEDADCAADPACEKDALERTTQARRAG
jgi:hypothetical protein